MSSELALEAENLGKAYLIYRRPEDRLKQMIFRRRKYYEEYWAVRDINLKINKGEAVGIIGRNGAGKSTFLQLAVGILAPTTGRVVVGGRVAALLELGAGFNPEFTGAENVYLSAAILGLTQQEIRDRFDSIVDFAAIGDFIHHPVKLYSSGMYARLAFAVAAHVDASVLVVDEILAVGDAAFTQKCMRFIRKFREDGTLIFVSHSPTSVLSLCDRAVWIDRGGIREDGDAQTVCDSYRSALEADKDDGSSFRAGGRRRARAKPESGRAPPSLAGQNPIAVEEFDPDSPWHGRRGATIQSVRFLDPSGNPLVSMHGGETVTLRVEARIDIEVARPIVGFIVRDHLGQALFGENTFLTYADHPVHADAGEILIAEFHFDLPYLPTNTYAVCVAVSEGTQADHVVHHWYDEALLFDVESRFTVRGLVGIPILAIDLFKQKPPASEAEPLKSIAG
jgi:lipopolysaccharide transport system ATP-binding protein